MNVVYSTCICMMKVCLVASSNCIIGLVHIFIDITTGGVYTFDSKNSIPLSLNIIVCVFQLSILVKYVQCTIHVD